MGSVIANQAREQVSQYLRGEIALDALQQWFVPATWGLDLSVDQFAADVLLRLAEFAKGDWREFELRAELSHLLGAAPALAAPTQSEAWVVRFVPFGTFQVVLASYPTESVVVEEGERERVWSETIRDTAVTHAVRWPEPSLRLSY